MYTSKPPAPNPTLSTGTHRATFRQLLWTIPEADHLQMHALTRLSQQVRLKAREALLCSLHNSSLYMRLVIANKEKEARAKVAEHAMHERLIDFPKEGINIPQMHV